jgi:DNA-binding NarL/FixJ family response regulator
MLMPTVEPREVTHCYQAGANSCVRKPVDFDLFHRTIQAVVRYWLDQNLAPPLAAGQRNGRALER